MQSLPKIDQNNLNNTFSIINHKLYYSTLIIENSLKCGLYFDTFQLTKSTKQTLETTPCMVFPYINCSNYYGTDFLFRKQLLKSTLLQSLLKDFLSSCTALDCNEILELIQGDIIELLNSKEGTRVALKSVWHATNKVSLR